MAIRSIILVLLLIASFSCAYLPFNQDRYIRNQMRSASIPCNMDQCRVKADEILRTLRHTKKVKLLFFQDEDYYACLVWPNKNYKALQATGNTAEKDSRDIPNLPNLISSDFESNINFDSIYQAYCKDTGSIKIISNVDQLVAPNGGGTLVFSKDSCKLYKIAFNQ